MTNPLFAQFVFHHKLYNNVLEGLTDTETNSRLYDDPRINHIKYIAGHLLNAQYGFGILAGVRFEVKWNELFAAMGRSAAKDDIHYPSIEEIKAEWNIIYKDIKTALQSLATDDLKRTPPKPMERVFEGNPDFENTVGGFWSFLNHHQAYHIGQIGILRKGFGKKPMSYQ
jgi:hypothetical protein